MGRRVPDGPEETFIQTDASINPGNSGRSARRHGRPRDRHQQREIQERPGHPILDPDAEHRRVGGGQRHDAGMLTGRLEYWKPLAAILDHGPPAH